jgi:hypothetical protein
VIYTDKSWRGGGLSNQRVANIVKTTKIRSTSKMLEFKNEVVKAVVLWQESIAKKYAASIGLQGPVGQAKGPP